MKSIIDYRDIYPYTAPVPMVIYNKDKGVPDLIDRIPCEMLAPDKTGIPSHIPNIHIGNMIDTLLDDLTMLSNKDWNLINNHDTNPST